MKKKIIRIVAIVLLLFVGLLIAVPFFLEGKIADIIKNKVNQNVNATLDFEEADLSLLASFPNAEVKLKGISLVNKQPFEGDTLFASENIQLTMAIKELFKGADEPIGVKSLVIDGANLNIKVDADENANYDIAQESGESGAVSENTSGNFTFDLQSYAINNSKISYLDAVSGLKLVISEMNHSGTGDLSLENSELRTNTEAKVLFEMDSTNYLNNHKVALEALIGIDLKENKYTFLENKALVNQLPLVFDGFVKVNEDNQEVAITFETPSSDFKNFLAVIPEEYSKNIENVQTTGNFEVDGKFEGIVDEEHIPEFIININADNASFKYPDLPKSVKNVFIDTEVANQTGIAEDTYVHIKKLSFEIDGDRFDMVSRITDLLGNTRVGADLDGKINLANISEAYPVPEDYNLSGTLTADVSTAFDMASVEQHQYQNTKTTGTMGVSGFEYKSPELKHPVAINTASMTFNPQTVALNSFEGKTGRTDFNANGTITNLLGYLFNNENIEGNFRLNSKTFAIDDFMVGETTEAGGTQDSSPIEESVKIPSFLDCTIDATADQVIYDNLNLTEVSGRLLVKDETATLQNLTSSLFGGKLNLNGKVSTKPKVPVFDMALGIDDFKISESFASMELLKVLAPIAKVIEGRLNSSIVLSGNLKDDFTPNLASLSGDVLAQLFSTELNPKNAPLLSSLDNKLNFLDLKELDLNGLKTSLSFNNGKVQVKPFDLTYKDIAIKVNGNHTFDQQLQYSATLDVPAKYLGAEVNKLISQIDDNSLENLTIPVIATIGGNYTNPNVSTDLTSGVKKLTAQLVEIQKQKMVDKGKDAAKDLIGGLFGGDTEDSTKTDSTTTSKKDILGDIFKEEQKDSTATQSDSVSTEDAAKKAAKNILGGLLGKKKKDSVE
ncbi:AsmA-like C-terminal region-containing protein [Allomuricauda sp. SCSIO 65647]|uniref:AsmA family protein n=1 Tax=Allomuricauda sp. SCSIO 65647 TaxID=2908843 RepID=UPI001F4921CA|nr:AsmA-like C-terminal region-containing protein [Muricauda sp. SCSIO 65647]UJH68308.1 AsmA family protein [Muricauda sp. SCSIO 65647]